MSDYSKIEIKTIKGESTLFSEIYLDGHKLRGVRGYKLEHRVGSEAPTLTVDLNALNVAIDQEVILKAAGFGDIDIKFKGEP